MREKTGSLVVIIPTFRCRQLLPIAIRSIVNQTYRNFNLYIIDDASDDISDEMLNLFPEITFIWLNNQQGPYSIANLILTITDSDFIAFQDADDESHPARFAEQIAFLTENNCLGCGSWFKLVDIEGDSVGFETCPENATQAIKDGLVANPILHPATFYDRKIFSALGGFDGSRRFAADTEFFLRASLTSKLGNVQKFLYEQTVRPNSLTSSSETGFFTVERQKYKQNIYQSFLSIQKGDKSVPADGQLLTGNYITPPLDAVATIRLGAGNFSLKEEYEKRYAGKLR